MEKITTRIFIYASIAFGIIGISLVLTSTPGKDSEQTAILMKLLLTTVFIILPSFALSIASKYLGNKS